jgi:hypothetical protein
VATDDITSTFSGSLAAQLPFDGLIAEVVRDTVEATRIETAATIEQSPDGVELREGHLVGVNGPERLWSFEQVGEEVPQPDTPGTLIVGADPAIDVTVVAVGDHSVVLAVRDELGDHVANGRLTTQAGFVYERLAGRLEELAFSGSADHDLIEALLLPDPGGDEPGGFVPLEPPGPEEDQERAAQRAVESGLRFTWGPPGTGKTGVLARAVALAVERGQRVLVLAHANAAVDVAIGRIAEVLAASDAVRDGRVLRVGTPHLPAALDHAEVLPAAIVAGRHPDLAERREELEGERRRVADQSRSAGTVDERRALGRRLRALRRELAELDGAIREVTSALIENSVVVATTLSKLVVDDRLWHWPADVVIVDEASMVGLPFLVALAARGATTLSCVGDFRQLPPICVSTAEQARRWFARDVFEVADVRSTHEAGAPDDRLSILRTQFRMGEQIGETVNQLAYNGMLRTHPTARRRAIRMAETWPAAGTEVVIVDTSDSGAVCLTDGAAGSWSRFNPLSAALSVTLAEAAAQQGCAGVGLLSPYRSHTRLLHAATRAVASVTSATIHRFQGSERDTVVFDLVDAAPQSAASRLTGTDAELALRLLNVAASRARGKLVIVADAAFIEERHPLDSPARALLRRAEQAGAEVVSALGLIADHRGDLDFVDQRAEGNAVSWSPTWADAVDGLTDRLGVAAGIEVHVPSADHAGGWLQPMLDAAGPQAEIVLRAPAPVAADLDRPAGTEVRLATVGPCPWLAIDNSLLLIGSSTPGLPAAALAGEAVISTFRRLTFPEQ